MEPSAADVGTRLRAARERRGISLKNIANATKISVTCLEALERNDLSRLPGGIFTRAFVRSYAAEVGLDPEATIRDFVAQFPQEAVTTARASSLREEDHESIGSQRRMATATLQLIGVALPIALLLIYLSVTNRASRRSASTPSAAGTHATAPAREVSPAASALPHAPSGDALTNAPAATAGPTEAAVASPAEPSGATTRPLTVRLTMRGDCWLSITRDGETIFSGVMRASEQRTVDADREISLRVGDAGAVAMAINNQPARPLGLAGEVRTLVINPTNVREFLPPQ